MVDGITEGDVEAGLRNSRHAVTLSALFRARVVLDDDSEPTKQTLILCLEGEDISEKEIKKEVSSLYAAAAAEKKDAASFDKVYDLQVVSTSSQTSQEVRSRLCQRLECIPSNAIGYLSLTYCFISCH
jgi:hypothetical protein